jgi:hypothetical protein
MAETIELKNFSVENQNLMYESMHSFFIVGRFQVEGVSFRRNFCFSPGELIQIADLYKSWIKAQNN